MNDWVAMHQTLSPSIFEFLSQNAIDVVKNNGDLRHRFLDGKYLKSNWLFAELDDERLKRISKAFDIIAFPDAQPLVQV